MRQIYSQVGLAVMLTVCAAALRWGARLERRVAVLIAIAWLATLVAQRLAGDVAPVPVLAALDAAVFALLMAFSRGERAGWPIYAVGCQGVALGVHAIRLFSPAMSTWTYLTALAASSYGLLLALAWGTWRQYRRARMGSSS